MHDPGHSSLGSGGAVAGGCVVGGSWGGLLGGGPPLVLSQQMLPFLQEVVYGMTIEGRSQKAAMILSKQKPGHFCGGGGDGACPGLKLFVRVVSAIFQICERRSPLMELVCEGGGGRGDVTRGVLFLGGGGGGEVFFSGLPDVGDGGCFEASDVRVMQQLSSEGQYASESMSSQKRATKPFTQSPSQFFCSCPEVFSCSSSSSKGPSVGTTFLIACFVGFGFGRIFC